MAVEFFLWRYAGALMEVTCNWRRVGLGMNRKIVNLFLVHSTTGTWKFCHRFTGSVTCYCSIYTCKNWKKGEHTDRANCRRWKGTSSMRRRPLFNSDIFLRYNQLGSSNRTFSEWWRLIQLSIEFNLRWTRASRSLMINDSWINHFSRWKLHRKRRSKNRIRTFIQLSSPTINKARTSEKKKPEWSFDFFSASVKPFEATMI